MYTYVRLNSHCTYITNQTACALVNNFTRNLLLYNYIFHLLAYNYRNATLRCSAATYYAALFLSFYTV